ncbi:hypothetical protein NQ318_010170 [Aromia moschata]|uniref:Uncharacterized protein n=1 Tax=Aromia moschata TaxID=1265417 RepID=A0AAV8XSE0_9CUCU|nr:hypothetical protein NQ318_010170 [Aromia moschata]
MASVQNDIEDKHMYLREFFDRRISSCVSCIPKEQDLDLPSALLWFQHDGASPHYARQVREFLKSNISRSVDWTKRTHRISLRAGTQNQ